MLHLDAMTLMWIQIATGFTGAFTLMHFFRSLMRKLGWVLELKVFFSPKGGCQEAVVQEINKARHEILVQAYSFTSQPITLALVEAKKRGLSVDILLDHSNEKETYSDLKVFLEHGLDPRIDHEHAIAHNKIILIDKRTIITGSFNFTNQAEHENAENLLIIKGHPDLPGLYRANFLHHKSHCKPAQVQAGAEQKDRRPHTVPMPAATAAAAAPHKAAA
jgi:phosphatidylserine/phosphatidylglycerophosphate/cardiolipin synthase-like enzyme